MAVEFCAASEWNKPCGSSLTPLLLLTWTVVFPSGCPGCSVCACGQSPARFETRSLRHSQLRGLTELRGGRSCSSERVQPVRWGPARAGRWLVVKPSSRCESLGRFLEPLLWFTSFTSWYVQELKGSVFSPLLVPQELGNPRGGRGRIRRGAAGSQETHQGSGGSSRLSSNFGYEDSLQTR